MVCGMFVKIMIILYGLKYNNILNYNIFDEYDIWIIIYIY